MKVLQVNVVYPVGSTGKIVQALHCQILKNGNESVVCYGRGEIVNERNVFKTAPEFIMKLQSLRSKITGYTYSGCLYSTRSLINIIKKEKPDVVHLHCINGYMVNIFILLEFLKQTRIPTILTLHAEFMYTAGCGHALACEKWKTGCGSCPQKGTGRPSSKFFDRSAEEWQRMRQAFEGFDKLVIVSVSGWLHDRAKESPFFMGKEMKVILNGIDTDNVFKPKNTAAIRKKFNITCEKVVLHVTANFTDPLKGGKHVINLANQLNDRDIRFFIVGRNTDRVFVPSNVTIVPQVKNQEELALLYSMADITLLTSQKETFSMICAESLACGTPVVGFEAGAPETISLKEYSEFVQQGDINALQYSVLRNQDLKKNTGGAISEKAKSTYSQITMYNEYLLCYKQISNRCCPK